jgi:hypothetical protein
MSMAVYNTTYCQLQQIRETYFKVVYIKWNWIAHYVSYTNHEKSLHSTKGWGGGGGSYSILNEEGRGQELFL